MEPIEMLIIGALVTWATERVADTLLDWVIERVKRDRNSNPKEQEEPGN
jgi:hypothetical protein